MNSQDKYALDTQEISFYDIAVLVKQRWKIIAVTMMVTTSLALAVALFSKSVYRASVTLAPVLTDNQAGISSLSSGLGGLASLAGLGQGDGGSIEQNIAILRSRVLADKFIAQYDLRPILFADSWNTESKKWEISPWQRFMSYLAGLINISDQQKSSAVASDGGPTPDAVYRKFDNARYVKLDKETGLVTLSMEWRDPQLSALWANQYTKIANEYIRAHEVTEAKKRLQYLSDEFRSTSLAEVQNAISKLMETELKRSMAANVREEFAFKVIDPAVVPELRVWPKRSLIVMVGLIGGFILGITIVLTQNYYRMMRDARQG